METARAARSSRGHGRRRRGQRATGLRAVRWQAQRSPPRRVGCRPLPPGAKQQTRSLSAPVRARRVCPPAAGARLRGLAHLRAAAHPRVHCAVHPRGALIIHAAGADDADDASPRRGAARRCRRHRQVPTRGAALRSRQGGAHPQRPPAPVARRGARLRPVRPVWRGGARAGLCAALGRTWQPTLLRCDPPPPPPARWGRRGRLRTDGGRLWRSASP